MKLFSVLLLSSLILPAAAERRFEENLGQAGVPTSQVRFLARDRGGNVFFTASEVVWDIEGHAPIRLSFAGASGKARWQAAGEPSGLVSYVVGADSSKWISGARQFDRIVWPGVYPGIDAVFYWNDGRLEYDLNVSPGADPSPVRLAWSGAPAHLLPDGAISVAGGLLKQRAPRIYQGSAPVEGRFLARAGEFHLALGRYDRRRPLVIDPVLEMATYVGGDGDDAVTVVGEGLVAGTTASVLFPGSPATRRRSRDAFVRGTGLLANGFAQVNGLVIFGGAGEEEVGAALYMAGSRQLVVGGSTSSDDFPIGSNAERVGPGTVNGFLCSFQVSGGISAFNSSCRLVGGSGEDRITALAAGSSSFYVFAGETNSPDLRNAVGSYSGGKDGFFGHSLLSSVFYLGGSEDDRILSAAYVTLNTFVLGGETRSPGFPNLRADSPGLRGPSDGFLATVTIPELTDNPVASISSVLIGGSGEDRITAISNAELFLQFVTANNTIFAVAGVTTSPDLPVNLAAQPTLAGESDAFAGVWRQGAFDWLTYLGGSGVDEATGVVRNALGDLFISGWTRSTDLKTVIPLQERPGGGEDAFYAAVGPGVVRTLTYYGGSGNDRATGITLIRDGVARIGGVTTSTDLPQVNPWQSDPGQGAEGFVADIGAPYLFAPALLQLAKDGSTAIPVRAAQFASGLMVTYRSSDPSKVRLFDGVSTASEFTVPLTREIRAEALADSGEAQILISAPGFTSASTAVKLFQGVLYFNSLPAVASSWSQPLFLSASWAPLDPDSGRPIPAAFGALRSSYEPRSGFRLPPFKWTSSDERVARVVTTVQSNIELTQLAVGVPGEARIVLNAQGLPVFPADGVLLKVVAPSLNGRTSVRLGKDLQAAVPYSFTASAGFGEVRTGTITARSADPSRLVLSTDPSVPGSESVTVPFSVGNFSQAAAIWAQALSSEGQVPVILSSPELNGELTTTFELEPSHLRWGVSNFRTQTIDPSFESTVGVETQLAMQLQGVSGSPASGPRPGMPEIQLRLENNAESVVEVNRVTIRQFAESPRVVAIAPGSATLTLTQPDSAPFPLANPTVRVDVAPVPGSRFFSGPPSSIVVGKDLQVALNARYTGGTAPITFVSEDPSAVVVSASATQPGQSSLTVNPPAPNSDYRFYVQALRDSGETGVVIKYPGGEFRMSVVLVPAAIGLRPVQFPPQGVDQAYEIVMNAVDERTGIALSAQTPGPGKKVDVTLRTTGAAARLTRETATLDAAVTTAVTVGVNLPPLGQEAVLIAEAPGSTARQVLRRLPRQFTVSGNTSLMQDTLGSLSVRLAFTSFSELPSTMKATSSDPESLLLGLNSSEAGRASVNWTSAGGSQELYLHALKGTGSATVTLEAEGYATSQIVVALSPLQTTLVVSGYNASSSIILPATVPVQGTLSIQATALRPGIDGVRVNLRTSDSSVLTVTPATLSFSGSSVFGAFTLTPKSPGQSVLTVEGDRLAPGALAVEVREVPPAALPITDISLGVNTQVEGSFSLGLPNPDGTIVTVTSADPSRLVVSRNFTTPGAASVTVALQPGNQSGTVFFQALSAEGEVIVTASSPGFPDRRWRVRLSPAWFTPFVQNATAPLGVGETRSLSFILEQTAPANGSQRTLRPGLGPLTLPIAATDPAPIELAANSLSLPDNPQPFNVSTQIRGAALGATSLRFDQPPGFGPVPTGRGAITLRVVPRSMSISCGSSGLLVLGLDMQVTCSIGGAPAGTVIEAVSSRPERLVLSQDPLVAGAGSQTITAGPNPTITFQALAASGTVEVLFSAPGYSDLRLPIVLRRTEIRGGVNPSQLTVGASGNLALAFSVTGPNSTGVPFNITARAGSNMRIGIAASPSGVVSLESSTATFAPNSSTASVPLRAVAAGSAVISLSLPDGYILATQPPITATVR